MPMYDFKCANEHTFEELAKLDTDKLPCPVCGAEAQRFLGAPPRFTLDGTDPGFPTAYDQWPKKRERQIRWERSRSYSKRYDH